MENKELKTGLAATFQRWNRTKVSQPRDIGLEVGKEFGVVKNSRQKYRAARKAAFERDRRGLGGVHRFEAETPAYQTVTSDLGEGVFQILPRPNEQETGVRRTRYMLE